MPQTDSLVAPRVPGTLFTPAFDRFFRTHERVMWNFSSIPFEKIDLSLITEDDINALRAAMLVESHNPVYTRVLLDYFRMDHEMAAFVVTWSYEEMKHYGVLRTYLEATGLVDLVDLERELNETRAGPWGDIESQFTVAQSFSYTMLQEELTGLFYQKFARRTKEPVLRNILTLVGKDEFRHCQWYLYKAKQVLSRNRHAREEVEDLLLRFEMPGPSFIQEYGKHGYAMLKVAPPDANSFRQVMARVGELTGRTHWGKLATDPIYVRKLREEWGMEPREVLSLP
ncbi:MAG: acyl-ACP desaturase [Chloroflexi bacterium]|nr:acyl-ACP desaturase [Chloroflexota bacterium]